LLVSSASLSAQANVPKRPRLGNAADTNDARAYYQRGMDVLDRNPGEAEAAFYWASRLEPGWAEALYARRIAGFIADENLLLRYWEGARGVYESRDVRKLDTLEYRAQMLNPLYVRDLEDRFVSAYLLATVNRAIRRNGGRPLDLTERQQVDYAVESFLQAEASDWMRGRVAASRREFRDALEFYRRALGERSSPRILVERARLFYLSGSADSALSQLREAVALIQKEETGRLLPIYFSKEAFEHSIAVIHERKGDLSAAREAYGRALQENLGYYPAHVRLGQFALQNGDTGQAMNELELAAQVAPNEPTVHTMYGTLLAEIGYTDEAVTHLKRAAELEPYFAVPHYVLGRIAEALGQRDPAKQAYQAFLERASRQDGRRAEVAQRLAAIGP
jgi:tetratricopeptide (TPR) repeat protein